MNKEIQSQDMVNKKYSIIVEDFAFGQYRIRITDVEQEDEHAPPGHGSIVQEMCTYKPDTMLKVIAEIQQSDNPVETARAYGRPWNQEYPGGRIRLDNVEKNFTSKEISFNATAAGLSDNLLNMLKQVVASRIAGHSLKNSQVKSKKGETMTTESGEVEEKYETPVEVNRNSDTKQIILPDDMSYDDAIRWLERRQEEDETFIVINEETDYFYLDGAYALNKALAEIYGWSQMVPIPGFFGSKPPQMMGVQISETETIQVPWGRMEIPNIKGYLQTDYKLKNGLLTFQLTGKVKQKHKLEVKVIAEKTREILSKESIYKGKALRISFPDQDEIRDGSVNFADYVPSFFNTDKVNVDELILPHSTKRLVEASIFTPIEKTRLVREAGIPLKRGVLLEGPYGVGKTLTANVTAKKAVMNGWTFLYLKSVTELPQAVHFARKYSPAVIFAEDIDRITSGDRDTDMDEILNTIDGIDTKNSELLVVLTTNNVNNIHKAMIRPGRLDAVIPVRPPDPDAVEQLIRLYGRGLIKESANLKKVAQQLDGQIPAMIREAIERAKLYSISTMGKEDPIEGNMLIDGDHLSDAASGMLDHLTLLNEEKEQISDQEQLGNTLQKVVKEAYHQANEE